MTNTDFWDSLDTVSTTPTPTPSPFQEEILENFDASTIMGELNSLEGTQTEDEIINNPTLMRGIREIMKSRYSEDTRNKFSFDEKYDKDLSDEEIFEEWQNWMRSLAGGQTVTSANDAAWFARADGDQRALMGASFNIMEKMPNLFSGEADFVDGARDYIKAALYDPTTILGLGIGRLWSAGVTKAAGMGLRVAAKEALKQSLKKGMTKDQAKEVQRKVLEKGFKNIKVKKAIRSPVVGATATDIVSSVGTDYIYQNIRIGSGVQDEFSLPQSVGTALSVIALPSLFATGKVIKEGAGKVFNFQKYVDISKKFGGKSEKEITDAVMQRVDVGSVSESLKNVFKDFGENTENYTSWLKVREDAAEKVLIKDIAGSSRSVEDLFESMLFFGSDVREVFAQTYRRDKKGKFSKKFTASPLSTLTDKPDATIITDGLVVSLAKAGFVHVPRGAKDNPSNFINDAIKYLPDETVKELMDNFSSVIGKDSFNKTDLVRIKTAEDLSNFFVDKTSGAGKTLFNRRLAADFLKKDPSALTPMDLLNLHKSGNTKTKSATFENSANRVKYVQSIWKRLVTSHPGTTGLNIKGWAFTTFANDISDVVQGSIEVGLGRKQEGFGSILGAVRRGYNVLDMNATIEQGFNFLKVRPEVADEILSEISGGIESRNVLQRLNLDPDAKINKLSEKSVATIQNIMGVKLQDEMTKMISFMSDLDQNIMRVYGKNYNSFMESKDFNPFVEMYSPKFVEKVLNPAIERTKKETYSYSWLEKGSKGLNPTLEIAKFVERISNSPGGGFLIPFGRFFNTATAFLGDYTMFNATKHVVGKAFLRDINLADEEGVKLFSKGVVGLSAIFAFGNEEAEYRVKNGLTYSQKPLPDGSVQDLVYDAPQNYLEALRQMVAHRAVDGKIPPELKTEFASLTIGQTFRQTGDFFTVLEQFGNSVVTADDADEAFRASLQILSAGASRITSGFTRFLEPVNTIASVSSGDFSVPDRNQGNKLLNQTLRYVDKIPTMFGFKPLVEEEEVKVGTREKVSVDAGKILGFRSSVNPTPSERIAASIGMQSFKAITFQGTPEYKNALDEIVRDIFNYEASKAIDDGFLEKDLDSRINDYEKILTKVKQRARSIFQDSRDKSNIFLEVERKVRSQKKRVVKDALEKVIKYDGNLDDFLDEMQRNGEEGVIKMQYLLYLIENKDEFIYN
jgi:hypothetical protein